MKTCPYCGGVHRWEDCPVVFTPITDCEFKDREDGCCSHPKNGTPECHPHACPRLSPKLKRFFEITAEDRQAFANVEAPAVSPVLDR